MKHTKILTREFKNDVLLQLEKLGVKTVCEIENRSLISYKELLSLQDKLTPLKESYAEYFDFDSYHVPYLGWIAFFSKVNILCGDKDSKIEFINSTYGYIKPGIGIKTDVHVTEKALERHGITKTDNVVSYAIKVPLENHRFPSLGLVFNLSHNFLKTARTRFADRVFNLAYKEDKDMIDPYKGYLSNTLVELVAPFGEGSRVIIGGSPGQGKTIMLRGLLTGIIKNHPEVSVVLLMTGERPEEISDIAELIKEKGKVFYSTFDDSAQEQISVVKRAKSYTLNESLNGRSVILFIDSLTRIFNAYNIALESRKVTTGGLSPESVEMAKSIFGLARNFEDKSYGPITVVATVLTEMTNKAHRSVVEEMFAASSTTIRLSSGDCQPCIDFKSTFTRRFETLFGKYASRYLQLKNQVISQPSIKLQSVIDKVHQKIISHGSLVKLLESFDK